MKRISNKLLSTLMVLTFTVTMFTGIPAKAAVDFGKMPVPSVDISNVGFQISRTMHLLETSTAEKPNTVKIAVMGQSIVDPPWGSGENSGGNTWCPDLVDWLKVKYPTANIEYRNYGIGGFAGGILMKRVPDEIRSFYPDLTILYVYGDENQFESMLGSMRRETQTDIIVLTSHYNQPSTMEDEKVTGMFPRLAEKYGVEICDIRTPWKQYLNDNKLSPSVFLKDDVHLNDDGQYFMLELMKQFFAYRPIEDNDPVFPERIKVSSDMWKNGKLTVDFVGNRVEVVAGSGAQNPAHVRVNGAKPSQYPGSYLRTLERSGMWGTKLGIVKYTGNPGNANWTVEITQQSPTVEYSLVGTRAPEKKYSVNGVVSNGGITLDRSSFIWEYGVPGVGSKLTFTTYFNGADTYTGRKNVLISGIVPGEYTLELTAKDSNKIPDIKELVIYNPDTRKQPEYTKPVVEPGPDLTPSEKPEEPPADPIEIPVTINNGSFENGLTGWSVFRRNNQEPESVVTVDEPENFYAVGGERALRIPESDDGLTQRITLEEDTPYKLTYYRYGGQEGNRGVEVMISSSDWDQAPFQFTPDQWKPISFTETPVGHGWVKCEKVYPPIIPGHDYRISIRGWTGEELDTYLDRISVTKPGIIYSANISEATVGSPLSDWLAPDGNTPFLVQEDGTDDKYVDINERNVANFIPLNMLTTGKRYKIIIRVKNNQEDLSGEDGGNTFSVRLLTTGWDPTNLDDPEIIYVPGLKPVSIEAKTGDMGQNAGYTEYSVEGVAPVPAQEIPEVYDKYRLEIELSGDKDTTVKMESLEIVEMLDPVGELPEGQPRPAPTPESIPTPDPTPTPQPSPSPSPEQEPKSISLDKKNATLQVGKSIKLVVSFDPADTTTEITWKSSNNKVAKVNKKGKVTALKKGNATITATSANGKKATCKIKVTPIKVKKVKLNKKKLNLKRGKTFKLKATVLPKKASNKKVKWTSSNNKVASVNAKGVVRARKKGKAFITVTTKQGKKKNKCVVRVK